jgi:hypothetical protein
MIFLPVTRPAPKLSADARAALVVATSVYTDDALTRLDSTARDAEEIAEVLADPYIGAFRVTSVVNRSAMDIRLAVQDFLEGRDRHDLAVVYLSCHGLLDKWDRLYFAAADTRTDRLASTGVEAEWLSARLEECRAASKVVILDCCNSGAFGRAGGKGEAETNLQLQRPFTTQGRGLVVLTASRANQRSWEGDPVGGAAVPSVFTSALVEGLRSGAADKDGDGYVSVAEAYAYVYAKVTGGTGGQVPQMSISEGEGTLLLARSRAGLTITPAPLPEYLQQLLYSPSPQAREIGVKETAGFLDHPDPRLALSAQQALQRIVDGDLPRVGDVARAALGASLGAGSDESPRVHSEPGQGDERAQPKAEVDGTGPDAEEPSISVAGCEEAFDVITSLFRRQLEADDRQFEAHVASIITGFVRPTGILRPKPPGSSKSHARPTG